jgi:hypothetical protein
MGRQSSPLTPQIVDKYGLAEILGVRPRTIAGWATKRTIPFIKISRSAIRFDVAKVLEAKTVNPSKTR